MAYSRGGLPHGLLAGHRNFASAPVNSGVPLLDQDLNLIQRIQSHRVSLLLADLFRPGWSLRGDFINHGINVFDMETSIYDTYDIMYLVDGTVIPNSNQITVETTVGRPAGQTFDVVFLELWAEEVREVDPIYVHGNTLFHNPAAITNDIVDPAIGIPSAVRMQFRYRIRSVAEVDADAMTALTSDPVTIQGKHATPEPPGNPAFNFLYSTVHNFYQNNTAGGLVEGNTVGGFTTVGDYDDLTGTVLLAPIALIERTVGDDDLCNAIITDLREPVALKTASFVSPDPSACGFEFEGQVVTPEVLWGVEIDSFGTNSVTVNLCEGNMHFIDLENSTADVEFYFENAKPGGVYHIAIKQHPITARNAVWPVDFDWVSGFPFSLSSIPGDIDLLMLVRTANPSFRAFGFGVETFNVPPCEAYMPVFTSPVNIDWDTCSTWRLLLDPVAPSTVNIVIDDSTAEVGGVYVVKIVQTSTPKSVTWPANVMWLTHDGNPHVLTDDPNGTDIIVMYYDGGGNYCAEGIGKFSGRNYLNDLFDVNAPGPSNGQVLTWNSGTNMWEASAVAANLNDLNDVNVPSPTPGQVLTYVGPNWEASAGGVAPHTLNDHTDVTVTGAPTGRFLYKSAGDWVWSSQSAVLNFVNFGGSGAGFETVVGSKSVADILQFKSLEAGANISFAGSTATNIRISASSSGGSVTSIAQGTGITCTPNPITGAGTVSNAGVLSVAGGAGINSTGGQNPSISSAAGMWEAHNPATVPFGIAPVTIDTLFTTTVAGRPVSIQCITNLHNNPSTSLSGHNLDTIRLYKGASLVRNMGYEATDLWNKEVSINFVDPSPGVNQTYRLEGISQTGVVIECVRSNMIAIQI